MELKFNPDKPEYEYIRTEEAANKALDVLEKEKILGIDTEGTGLDPHTAKVLLVQVGNETMSYIFDAHKLDLAKNERFKKLLENPKTLKILQNAKFDYKMLITNFDIKLSNIYDTMLAEQILSAGLGGISFGLLGITQRYLDLDLTKEVGKTFTQLHLGQDFSKAQLEYSALDTLVLFPIFQQQWPKLKKEDLIKVAKLEFAVTTVVGDMELNGIYLDKKKWRGILSNLQVKRDELAQEFQEMVRPHYSVSQTDMFSSNGLSDAININSQMQLMDLFNNRLHLGLDSTGVAVLQSCDHPVAKKLMEYRGFEKLLSAFGETLLEKVNPKTKRLHPNFSQLRTATGRFACNNPNLQQIPARSKDAPFRSCFNPIPGYKLVTTDYSSQEMRILAELSGDKTMLKGLNDGLDMHSFTASMMFNKEYVPDFKKKFPELRQAAKAIGFGLMYGMGPMGLARRLEVTPEVGEDYMKKYFTAFPHVRKFLDGMADSAVKKGWSTTAMGRKRWYKKPEKTDPDFRRKNGSIQRQAKNHPIQGTAADMIKFALVYIDERIKKEGIDAKVTHTVHDEIVCEVRNDQAEKWSIMQVEEMERAGALFIKKMPVLSDSYVGDVWEH